MGKEHLLGRYRWWQRRQQTSLGQLYEVVWVLFWEFQLKSYFSSSSEDTINKVSTNPLLLTRIQHEPVVCHEDTSKRLPFPVSYFYERLEKKISLLSSQTFIFTSFESIITSPNKGSFGP